MRRAFTLIELLVSMAIIAVLIGILLPVLPKVRNAARQTACGASLRSVGQGIEMYKNDFKEVFPVARYMPPPWLSGDVDVPLNIALERYIEPTTPAYRCAGDKIIYYTEYTDDNGKTQISGMSYTYLSALGGRPYQDIFFVKRLGWTISQVPLAHDFDGGTFETQDGRFVFADFFHDKRNMLFADGHVGRFGGR